MTAAHPRALSGLAPTAAAKQGCMRHHDIALCCPTEAAPELVGLLAKTNAMSNMNICNIRTREGRQ